MTRLCPWLLAAALLAPAGASAEPRPQAHEQAWRDHLDQPLVAPSLREGLPAPTGREAAVTADRQVVGYLPYWISDLSTIPWESLTRISWFAVGANADGGISTTNGWGGASVQSIVDTAHGYGIEVLMTVTLFDDDAICALVNSSSRRATFVNTVISQIQAGDADGVSIDFETTPASCMGAYETLISELATALHLRGWVVDIAMPAVDWSWGFDYGLLAQVADSLFIMGYNYHWSGGNPGPVDPLYGGAAWGPYCLDWTVQDYLADAGAWRSKIILGLPTYGIKWQTTSEAVPGTSAATGSSILWSSAHAQQDTYGREWDSTTHTPFYRWTTGGASYQVWYQDTPSMEDRFDYTEANGLGGIGFWALGYDGGDSSLWAAVDDYSGAETTGPVGDLVGYIREGDIFEGPPVTGAVVTLTGGSAVTVDEAGYYRFAALPAGVTYTVTASADCYETAVATRYVEAGITNWKSMALTPIDDCTPPQGCQPPGRLMGPASTAPGGGAGWMWAGLLLLAGALRRR